MPGKIEPSITIDELYAELEASREYNVFTPEQMEFIRRGREHARPVPWWRMVELFNKIHWRCPQKPTAFSTKYQKSLRHYKSIC